MAYDPDQHHRRSLRLKGYDYTTAGAYFVTICTQNRANLFGEIRDGIMHLNAAGHRVQQAWQHLPQRFPTLGLDAFVVMPNHIHGILLLHPMSNLDDGVDGATGSSPADRVGGRGHGVGTRPTPTETNGPVDQFVGAPLVGARLGHGPARSPADGVGGRGHGVGTRPTPTETNGPSDQTNPTTANAKIALGHVVGAFKSITTYQYTLGVNQQNWEPFHKRLWKRNYYEHIIRDEIAWKYIQHYIQTNPITWYQDQLHPKNPSQW